MTRQTTQISAVDRKDRTCGKLLHLIVLTRYDNHFFYFLTGYWIVIISLFAAIVIVASIPKM